MAFLIILTLAVAAAFSAGFVVAMMPILRRYAVARPNTSSSHAEPTPQGAGLAVVLATVLATVIGLVFAGPGNDVTREAAIVLVASLILAATGAIDDLRPLGPFAKLVPQVLAVALVIVFAAPADARLFPVLPFALERVLAVLADSSRSGSGGGGRRDLAMAAMTVMRMVMWNQSSRCSAWALR